ncbi:MAG: PIN domain-containing protein [Deltaproteobacteria bacterium]|nr:PIN domain-containing protein [Deltaproteobacteria bacterium]
MIYLDTSAALAHLLAEDRSPPFTLWQEPLVSSRLLEYEAWTRINARGLRRSHGDALAVMLARVAFVELTHAVLVRALEPIPAPVRTLDALHLASIDFLRGQGQDIRLATYDERMTAAARRMRIPLVPL